MANGLLQVILLDNSSIQVTPDNIVLLELEFMEPPCQPPYNYILLYTREVQHPQNNIKSQVTK